MRKTVREGVGAKNYRNVAVYIEVSLFSAGDRLNFNVGENLFPGGFSHSRESREWMRDSWDFRAPRNDV